MIKAIIFDAGDVYLKGDFHGFIEKSCDILGLDHRYFKNRLDDTHPLNHYLNLGKMDHIAAFEEFFEKRFNNLQKELMLEIWDNTWKLDMRMRSLAEKLSSSYLIAILSNSETRYEKIAEENSWYSFFDAVIYSHKIGMIKPNKEIYLYTAEVLGVSPDECVVIDDNPLYVIGAEKAGMKAILFRSYLELLKGLKELDITP
ncbi:HAD-IA family hydrolase [Candidatus Woesearchaeota archaeon]|nr:HAD-IA family hydrolase [Candidatus Woesearchaeota archaeon]